jgi:hypothetical protein
MMPIRNDARVLVLAHSVELRRDDDRFTFIADSGNLDAIDPKEKLITLTLCVGANSLSHRRNQSPEKAAQHHHQTPRRAICTSAAPKSLTSLVAGQSFALMTLSCIALRSGSESTTGPRLKVTLLSFPLNGKGGL